VNISASAVVVADGGSLCLRDGMIANGVVDVQSNNQWRNGWCIHSNDHVEVNQNSLFESGVIVSMPDLDLFEMPASGFQQNQGLQAALRDNVRYTIGILDRIRPGSTNSLYTALRTPGSPERPSYITNDTLHTTRPNGDIVPGSFVQGRVHEWTCTGNQDLTFKPANNGSNVYSNFVLLTNCDIQLAGNVELRNVVIFTTSQSAQSIKASGGGGGNNGSVNIGQADSCAAGGGAQIITRGGFKAPAGLQLNGGQIIAWGDIQFAAQGAGGRGASLIANGRIDGTSNLAFTGCGGAGMEGNLTVQSQRLAR
jgi:hypothetical protein